MRLADFVVSVISRVIGSELVLLGSGLAGAAGWLARSSKGVPNCYMKTISKLRFLKAS